MYDKPIGVSILTNGARLERLRACVDSFLDNCRYRPLVFGVFDNCSTDGTADYLRSLSKSGAYGVEWRVHSAPEDMGCAEGTNRSVEMVNDCEYIVHVESDFAHLPPESSGEDKMWLRRALDLMEAGECDYMYLRRMVDERDIFLHWWSQWMDRVDMEKGRHMRCPGFWWSNNPTLFRAEAMWLARTLPLDVSRDGAKGTPGWSRPELSAPPPPNAWIHKWGLFVHEAAEPAESRCGTDAKFGCKYGFFRNGIEGFCKTCDRSKGYVDMTAHAERYAKVVRGTA
jgi:glycosyltransferase involved in cell wall biosynthesis